MKVILVFCALFTLNIMKVCNLSDSSGPSINNNCDSYLDSTLNKQVYYNLSESPTYIGGQGKLLSYIADNLKIKREDYNFSKIAIYFIIDEKGNVAQVSFKKKIPEELRKKIEKLFENTNNWMPGKCNGKEVISRVETTFGW